MEWNQLLPYEKYLTEMKNLTIKYPEITVKVLGKSEDNREICGLFYGDGEKTLICCGGVHGRENINPYVLLRILEKYGKEKREFGDFSLLFIPMLNPDGYEIARAGFSTLKNLRLRRLCQESGIEPKEWKNNARNVDINRNFPSIHYKPDREGAYSGSEKETQILIKVIQHYPKGAFLDFHSRGEMIYFYRTVLSDKYNERQFLLAKELQKSTGYALGNKWDDLDGNLTGGNTVHFYSEFTKNPAITLETVPETVGFPISPLWQEKVFVQIGEVPENMIRFFENLAI